MKRKLVVTLFLLGAVLADARRTNATTAFYPPWSNPSVRGILGTITNAYGPANYILWQRLDTNECYLVGVSGPPLAGQIDVYGNNGPSDILVVLSGPGTSTYACQFGNVSMTAFREADGSVMTLWGLGGNDVLVGGTGTTYLHGGPGDDWIVSNTIEGGYGNNYRITSLFGDAGNDVLVHQGTEYYNVVLNGGDGNDCLETNGSPVSQKDCGGGTDRYAGSGFAYDCETPVAYCY